MVSPTWARTPHHPLNIGVTLRRCSGSAVMGLPMTRYEDCPSLARRAIPCHGHKLADSCLPGVLTLTDRTYSPEVIYRT